MSKTIDSRTPNRLVTGPLLAILAMICLFPTVSLTAQGWDPDTEIEFDLRRGRVTEAVPFDVRFFLVSPAPWPPERIRELEAWIQRLDNPSQTCDPQQDTLPCASYPDDACGLSIDTATEGQGQAAKHLVEIRVPALHPRKDYCLLVKVERRLTPAEVSTIEGAIRSAISSVTVPEVLTADESRKLCDVALTAGQSKAEDLAGPLVSAEQPPLEVCLKLLRHQYFQSFSDQQLREVVRGVVEEVFKVYQPELPSPAAGDPPLVERFRALKTPAEARSFIFGLPPGQEASELTKESDLEESLTTLKTFQATLQELAAAAETPCAKPPASGLAVLDCLAQNQLERIIDQIEDLQGSMAAASSAAQLAARSLSAGLAQDWSIVATTRDTFKNRFGWYVTAETGFAHAWELDDSFVYGGANLYFAPLNKKAPLSGWRWHQRVHATLGLPENTIDSTDPVREGIVLDRAMLLGLGVRLTDYLTLTTGAVVFDEKDPDPLIDDTRGLKASPFVSLALDIDVVPAFSNIFSSILGSGDDS